jgi:hypothetical protein
MDCSDKMITFLGCNGVSLEILLGFLIFKIKAQRFFENSGPLMQHHVVTFQLT